MANILVINAGSSSLKYQLIDIGSEKVIAKGICERIGIDGSLLKYKPTDGQSFEREVPMRTHEDAIKLVLDVLTDKNMGVIADMGSIAAVGHRVLHGGEKFSAPALIDDDVIAAIEECIPLGPLHNPANLMGIHGCMAAMPGVPMVAVFDTAWGQTMEPEAYMYALPYEAYQKHRIRRYGFHGTSHRYVTGKAIEKLTALGMRAEDTRVITCHLGNGSSLSAAKGGKCVDTTMGLTPLEGLPMGTRCGSIDPAIVLFLIDKLGMTTKEVENYMNKQSGVFGISGLSSDFRDLAAASKEGNARAKLAVDLFCYKVRQYIGAYAVALGGVDAIAFTAGVAENDGHVRELCVKDTEFMGVEIDIEYNRGLPRGTETEISTPNSRVKVYIILTDEEMMIARDTAEVVGL